VLLGYLSFQVYETKVALVQNCHLSRCIEDSEWLWQKVQGFLIAMPCIAAALWIPFFFSMKQLHEEFGRATSYVIGESSKLSSMYQNYQAFLCSLKGDFFGFFAVTLRLLIIVIPVDSVEFGVTIAAIPVFLMLIPGCAYAVRNEIKWMISIALVFMLPCMVYFLYKLVRFYLPSSREDYFSACWNTTVSTVFMFGPFLYSFWLGFKCFQDFDKGLLDSKIHGINEYQQLCNALEEGIQHHRSDNSHRSNDLSGQLDS